jgi:hypothetical protein
MQGVVALQSIHLQTNVATPLADALAVYHRKLESNQLQIEKIQRRRRALLIGLSLLLLAAVLAVTFSSLSASLVPIAAAAFLLQRIVSSRKELVISFRLSDWCERGIARLEGKWQGQGITGEEFSRDGHLYEGDLDILGPGSIFELLATTRSAAGAERLAAYLLDPTDAASTRARQVAVLELQPQSELRESLALVGRYAFQECDAHALRSWLAAPTIEVSALVPFYLLVSSVSVFVLGTLTLIGFFPWHSVAPLLLPLLAIQGLAGLAFLRRVRPVLDSIAPLTGEFAVLKDGLAEMRRHNFVSEKLRALADAISPDALARMTALQRLAGACEQRRKDVLYQFSLFLCLGTQLALAIERWRRKHGADLARWLDAWAEFEALNAISGYAYEHPGHVFPEIVEGIALFHAENLGHPLLPARTCVTNDLWLDRETAFHLVTGSNMAGKSTWLRAVGVAAVLSAAGAPVCATYARMSLFTICASISIVDSLAAGKSKFLAEVERLRATLDMARHHPPVLFLIDEILSGTNSTDRHEVAVSVLHALVGAGAVGLLSTHDSSLVPLAKDPWLRGRNFHMGSENPDDPLDFDYCIKSGPVKHTNALAITRMVGIGVPSQEE